MPRKKPSIYDSPTSVRHVRHREPVTEMSGPILTPQQINRAEKQHNARVRKLMFQNFTVPTVMRGLNL
jgi:hypothetical protein